MRTSPPYLSCMLLGAGTLLIGAAGCSEPQTNPPAEALRGSIQETNADAARPATGQQGAGDSSDESVDESASEETSPSDSEAAEVVETPAKRLMVLTTGGPLLVDLQITIDGKPYATGIDSLVDLVLAAGDTDQDGIPTWDELAGNLRFVYGPLGGNRGNDARQASRWKEQYDLDKNGWISAAEARSWLGRGAGRSARSLALESSRALYYEPRRNSRVWTLLDVDGSGTLAADELRRAAARLEGRDADADGIVYLHDLESLRDQLRATEAAPVSSTMVDRAYRRAAWLLDEEADWQLVAATLTDLYAAGRGLTSGSFPNMPELFDALDADRNGRLALGELQELTRRAAHAHLQVHFSAGPSNDAASTISFSEPSRSAAELIAATPTRATIRIGEATVVFSCHDTISRKDYGELASERLAMLDQDGSGYVDAAELAGDNADADEGFLAFDADGDGMVVAKEIADYLRLEDAVARSQIRIVVHDRADALFEQLDVDKDGGLGEREVAEAENRLLSLDANGDGTLNAAEISGQMNVTFLRGAQNEQLDASSYFPIAATSRTRDAKAPSWFRRGDFNGDGDISRREFLGTPEQFEHLDTDRNGFISAGEARAESDE